VKQPCGIYGVDRQSQNAKHLAGQVVFPAIFDLLLYERRINAQVWNVGFHQTQDWLISRAIAEKA
jgi:hypothetical protein